MMSRNDFNLYRNDRKASAQLLCKRPSAFTFVNAPSCPTVVCEALARLHAAGVFVPLHFAVFVCAPAAVDALN